MPNLTMFPIKSYCNMCNLLSLTFTHFNNKPNYKELKRTFGAVWKSCPRTQLSLCSFVHVRHAADLSQHLANLNHLFIQSFLKKLMKNIIQSFTKSKEWIHLLANPNSLSLHWGIILGKVSHYSHTNCLDRKEKYIARLWNIYWSRHVIFNGRFFLYKW